MLTTILLATTLTAAPAQNQEATSPALCTAVSIIMKQPDNVQQQFLKQTVKKVMSKQIVDEANATVLSLLEVGRNIGYLQARSELGLVSDYDIAKVLFGECSWAM